MNLTKAILIANSYLSKINLEIFFKHLNEFAILKDFSVDWDREDGEQWGRLLVENNVAVLFNARMPIIFVNSVFHEDLLAYFEKEQFKELVIIEVKSWALAEYELNLSEIADIIKWKSSNVPEEKISINDIWYATV